MDTIIRSIEENIATKQAILANQPLLDTIQAVANLMIKALREGKRILWCGNGGSAADAQHLAAELSGRFYYDRPRSTPKPCIVTHPTSLLLRMTMATTLSTRG